MQGYARLHQAKRGMSGELGRQAVQEAVGNLFQAMAVFQTAGPATQYGQQEELAVSYSLVRHVVRDILVRLTDSYSSPGPQVWQCFTWCLLLSVGVGEACFVAAL